MRTIKRPSIAALTWFGVAVVCAPLAVAQTAKGTGGSLTDSPYKNGPPPVSGGYTDTTQGGAKTSGDMPVLPPGADGKNKAATSGQQSKGTDSQQHATPQGEKAGPSGG